MVVIIAEEEIITDHIEAGIDLLNHFIILCKRRSDIIIKLLYALRLVLFYLNLCFFWCFKYFLLLENNKFPHLIFLFFSINSLFLNKIVLFKRFFTILFILIIFLVYIVNDCNLQRNIKKKFKSIFK